MTTYRRNLILFIVLMFAVVLLIHTEVQSVLGRESNSNFRELIVNLNQQVKNEGIIFTIVLSNYANAAAQERTIGTGENTISEIGDDYVCINRVAGAALTKSCIPFTNISAITTLDT